MEKDSTNIQEKVKEVTQILKIMANEKRLLILCALIDSPLTVNAIHEQVTTISQSGISQHLALLKAHGIVNAQKQGQFIEYSIRDTKITELMHVLKNLYCS